MLIGLIWVSSAAVAAPVVATESDAVLLELVGGAAVGGGGALLGASIAGYAVDGDPSTGLRLRLDWDEDSALVGAGWVLGGALGATYGVHGVQRALLDRSEPSFGRVLGGALVGGAVGVVVAGTGLLVAGDAPGAQTAALAVGAIGGPVLGAVVASEIGGPSAQPAEEAPAAPNVALWAAPRPGGGALGAVGRF